jgi:hypothetical protein
MDNARVVALCFAVVTSVALLAFSYYSSPTYMITTQSYSTGSSPNVTPYFPLSTQYGNGSHILTSPATWITININGTTYKVPAYS